MRKLNTYLSLCVSIAIIGAQDAAAQADSSQQHYTAAQKSIGRSFSHSFYPNYATVYALPEKAFLARMDSARHVFLSLLDEYRPVLSPAFVTRQENEVNYYFDKLLIDYPDNYKLYTGKKFHSPALIRRLDKNLPDLNKPALLQNEDFTNYVISWMAYQLRRELKSPLYKNQDNQELNAVWRLIPVYFTNEACRNFWKTHYLYTHIENNGIKNIEKIYTCFRNTCSDTGYLNKISAIYAEDSTGRQGHITRIYKTVGSLGLDMHIFLPDSVANGPERPVIVYFHGGSWSEGKPDWFFEACKAQAQKGWVACAVEYRIYGRHGTLPFEAVKDARSAIRWIRQHAGEYNIDTSRVIASGNSAGGHLVLCTALANQWNEKTDDLHTSPAANILLVNAGVYDLTDDGTAWIRRDLKDKNIVKQISPNHLPKQGMPPTLLIHGMNDRNVPYPSAAAFATEMEQAGNNFEFHPLEEAGHFIWYDPKYAATVGKLRSDFLKKLGY